MKFTYTWLKSHLSLYSEDDIHGKILQALTNAGIEVDGVYHTSISSEFVVVKIIEIISVPGSKLNICTVDAGPKLGILNVVCGGKNVRINMLSVLAPIGSRIHGNEIVLRKFSGYPSKGMMLSEDELSYQFDLGIPKGKSYIIDITNFEVMPGDSFADAFELNNTIYDVSITPNRGDWLSVFGIAREIKIAGLGALEGVQKLNKFRELPRISYIENNAADQYYAIEIDDLDNTKKTSPIIASRLWCYGLECINPIVDLSNYFTIDIGQPNHIFDRNKVKGKITIGYKTDDLQHSGIHTVNNSQYNCNDGDIISYNDDRIIALTGIIGSSMTAVSCSTKSIIVESALLDKNAVMRSSNVGNIHSESSLRFSKGVDPNIVYYSLEKLVNSIIAVCGGKCKGIYISNTKDFTPIKIKKSEVDKHISPEVLNKMGYLFSKDEIAVPSWRNDVTSYRVLISDYLKVMSVYSALNNKHNKVSQYGNKRKFDIRAAIKASRSTMLNNYYNEIVSYSFISEKVLALYGHNKSPKVTNPINQELSYMRTSIIPCLVSRLENSVIHSNNDVSVFEVGTVFDSNCQEHNNIAGLRTGQFSRRHWNIKSRDCDIFDIKADIERVLLQFNIKASFIQKDMKSKSCFLHDGVSAVIVDRDSGKELGEMGELHPYVIYNCKLKKHNKPVFVFYLNLDLMLECYSPSTAIQYGIYNKKSTRDLCCRANKDAGTIVDAVKSINTLISEVYVFDKYISNENDTISIGIEINEIDKVVVDKIMKEVISALEAIGCGIRS